jgi:hypothetical protein
MRNLTEKIKPNVQIKGFSIDQDSDSLSESQSDTEQHENINSKLLEEYLNGNRRLMFTIEEIIQKYGLKIIDMPDDGHCFLNAINKFKEIDSGPQSMINLDKMYYMVDDYFLANRWQLETYYFPLITIQMPIGTEDDDAWKRTEYKLKERMFRQELDDYFFYRRFEHNNLVDVIITAANDIFKIDLLILQLENIQQHALIYSKSNFRGSKLVTVYKTSNDDNSHYQLIMQEQNVDGLESEETRFSLKEHAFATEIGDHSGIFFN